MNLLTFRFGELFRSALEQKKAEEEKEFGAIDYDASISSDKKTIGLGTQVKVFISSILMHDLYVKLCRGIT